MTSKCQNTGGKMRRIASSLLVCLSLAFTGSAFAHHGFNAEFDASKSMRWMGIVTKVEWTNPHARFYIDVKDSNGSVTNWNFEMGSVLQLRRQGWTRDSLKVGDQVTVEGYPAKDGAKSPGQNGVAERWVESCRRDLLDHVIATSERHLKRLLSDYVRPHSLGPEQANAVGQSSVNGLGCGRVSSAPGRLTPPLRPSCLIIEDEQAGER